MSDPPKAIVAVATRLGLQPKNCATPEQIEAIERVVGAPIPGLLRSFMLELGETTAILRFDADVVLFCTADDVLRALDMLELGGQHAVPFAVDFFDSLWLVRVDSAHPEQGGRVLFAAVQERYVGPAEPVEPRADSFGDFLNGLWLEPDSEA